MVFAACDDDDGGDDGGDEEGEVDLHVCEQDEPFVPAAFFELACAFCTADTACWVFSADTWECQWIVLSAMGAMGAYQYPGRNGTRPML